MNFQIDTDELDGAPSTPIFSSITPQHQYKEPAVTVNGVSFPTIPTWCFVIAVSVIAAGSVSAATNPLEQPILEHVSLALPMDAAGAITSGPDKLAQMKSLNVDWAAVGSEPPNDVARNLAVRVLNRADSMHHMIEPAYVTASAEGGIGIVYKTQGRYAALECLNNGTIWMLWFDLKMEPHSEQVEDSDLEIRYALERVAALQAHNA